MRRPAARTGRLPRSWSRRARRAAYHHDRIESSAGIRRLDAARDYLLQETADTDRDSAHHAIHEAAQAVARLADVLNDHARKETH
jgi:hypothetical protein